MKIRLVFNTAETTTNDEPPQATVWYFYNRSFKQWCCEAIDETSTERLSQQYFEQTEKEIKQTAEYLKETYCKGYVVAIKKAKPVVNEQNQ